jgi:ribosomal protein S18 acetylase RimI-like enzyme
MPFIIRHSTKKDQSWIIGILIDNWASNIIVTKGIAYEADSLPAIISEIDGKRNGLLTYDVKGEDIEIVTMNAIEEGKGIGTALLNEIESIARKKRCRRLWLITTNDNTDAIRFYQMRGFEIAGIHRHAIEGSRKIKPQLPLVGKYGIPIRDEIEMEKLIEEK